MASGVVRRAAIILTGNGTLRSHLFVTESHPGIINRSFSQASWTAKHKRTGTSTLRHLARSHIQKISEVRTRLAVLPMVLERRHVVQGLLWLAPQQLQTRLQRPVNQVEHPSTRPIADAIELNHQLLYFSRNWQSLKMAFFHEGQ